LIIASPWRWFYSHPQALVKACCVEAVTQLDKGGYFQLFFARALFERTEFHFDPYIIRGGAFRHQITLERQDLNRDAPTVSTIRSFFVERLGTIANPGQAIVSSKGGGRR
jgi:hypothetical protein